MRTERSSHRAGASVVGHCTLWTAYPAYDYNFVGLERNTVSATEKLPPGPSTLRFDNSRLPEGQRRDSVKELPIP